MKTTTLGSQGFTVSQQGLGCMGMSEFYGGGDDTESLATIERALELGVTFLDTADMYGPHTNERLVGRALAARRAHERAPAGPRARPPPRRRPGRDEVRHRPQLERPEGARHRRPPRVRA